MTAEARSWLYGLVLAVGIGLRLYRHDIEAAIRRARGKTAPRATS